MPDLIVIASVASTIIYCIIAVYIAVLVQGRPRPQVYCVKERVKREIIGAHTVVFKNGRRALKGKCKSCGTTLFRMESSRNPVMVLVRDWRTTLTAWIEKAVRPQAYCMKERTTRQIAGAHTVVLRNGRKALQGKCKSCGTTLFRMK